MSVNCQVGNIHNDWVKYYGIFHLFYETIIFLSGMPRGYMILSRPEGNQNAKTYIRLPWQQARVEIMTLSDDARILFPLYVLRKFKNHWITWLNKSNKTNEKILQKATDQILKFTSNINSNNKISEDGDVTDNWLYRFEYEEIKHSSTFRSVQESLSVNYSQNSLSALKNITGTVCDLIEVGPAKNYQNLKRSSIRRDVVSKEEVDKLAQIISMLIIFWPYSKENRESNDSVMLKEIDADKNLFSFHRKQSITQQINFILKALEHVGHEHIYKKNK
jgi:hypothetical protein